MNAQCQSAIRGQRLPHEPAFAAGAKRLGDQVAAEALNSTIVEELETAATQAASKLQTA